MLKFQFESWEGLTPENKTIVLSAVVIHIYNISCHLVGIKRPGYEAIAIDSDSDGLPFHSFHQPRPGRGKRASAGGDTCGGVG